MLEAREEGKGVQGRVLAMKGPSRMRECSGGQTVLHSSALAGDKRGHVGY